METLWVSAGISSLKDFSGASSKFSQRAKSHEALVGMEAMGKGVREALCSHER